MKKFGPVVLFYPKAIFFRRACFLFILFIGAGFNNKTCAQPGPAWEYSKNILISGAGTPVAGYQIQVILTAGQYTGMNADGSDLRFYVGSTPCNFWIEKWNNTGQSVIWVKVPAANTTVVTMYYGNAAASSAVSPGTDVFDFFDDFNSWDPSVWDANVTVSGSEVTLQGQDGGYLSNRNPFPIDAGSSYFLEAKHNEASYYRVRFYATTTTGGNGSNGAITGLPDDYGYFSESVDNSPTANVFWQGAFNQPLNAGTDYITQWQITDNTHFRWSTLYSDYTTFASDYLASVAATFRYITIAVTEGTASTSVDWIRVRKSAGSDAAGISIDPVITLGSQVQAAPTISGFDQSSVCAGGSVTTVITGANFDNTSNVTFNGIGAQSFHIDSRTQITATSKSGVTAGPIVVTAPGGAATSSANLVVNPLPGLFTVQGGGNYCSGTTTTGLPITLSGSETGVTYQLYKGAAAAGSPVDGDGNALNFADQTGDASFTIVAINKTTGCSQQMTGAQTVVIDPLPIQYNVTGTGNFCSGGAGLAVGLNGSQAGVNYQLYLGATPVGTAKPGTGGALSFGLQTVAGTYTVKAVNSSTGCPNDMAGNATITVNPLPTGTISITENSGTTPNDGKICTGNPITFTAPAGYTNYVFKINGTPVGTQPVPNVYTTSALLAGTPVVTVEVTDGNGCKATLNTSAPVSVSNLPTGTFAPSVNTVCPGTSVTFIAPTGYANYIFKVNGGSPVNRGSLSSYSYNTLANGDVVSVDVTNSNGCMKTFTAIPMIIKPLPGAAGTIIGTTELCAGTNNVAYNVAAISNATSYIWTLPAGATGSLTGNSINVNFSNSATTGNITVAGVNGCATGVPSSLQVIVNPLPKLQIADPAPVCFPSTVDLTAATVTSGSTIGLSFTYFKDAAGTVSLPSPNAVAVSGTYYIKGTTVKGCADIIKPVVVIVNSLPTLQIHNPSPVCSSNSIDLTATAVTSGSTAGLTFTYFTDAAGTNALASPNAVMAPGTYYIKGTSTAGCSDVIKPVVVTINPLPTAGIANDANIAECLNSIIKPGVIFTGAGGTAPYTFTYTVNGGGNQTISTTSGNSVTVYQPTTTSGTFTYTLVSVKDNSSTQCANIQAGTVNVTVHSLPLPVLTGPDKICPDDVSDYTTETGQSNYIWTINGGSLNSGGSATDPTAQVHWANNTSPKSIFVNYTDVNGCSGATSVSVVSTSPTTPAFLASGPKKVCINSTGNVYEVQSDPTYTDYVWSITGGTITSGGGADDNTATVTWNTSGPQTISVNFNSGTCSAPAPTAYPVTVNTLPTATVTTNDVAVCQNGTSPIITFTGADGAANYTFSYTINGVAQADIVSSGNSKTVTVPTIVTSGDYIYQLTNVADNNTCSQVQTNAVTVTVHRLPTAAISGTAAVCANSPQPEITFTGSNGTAPYTFTYKIGTGSNQTVTTSSGNSVTVSAPTTTPGDYDYTLVSVADANGCEQTFTETATITVNPLPTAAMTGPTALCLNDADNITFTGGNGTAPYTFTYTIDGGANQTITTISGNSVTVPITTNSAQTFSYQLISVQDASSTACVQNQTGTLSVIVSAVSLGGTATGDATVCTGANGGSITLGTDKVGNVIRWESSIDGGTTWLPISNVTSSLTYTNLTTTTQYRAIVQSGTCTEAASNAVTITVNTANGGTVDHGPSGTGTVCEGTSGSVTLTGNSGPVLRWEYSTDGGTNWIVDGSKTDTFYNFINIDTTTWYRAYSQANGCTAIYSTVYKETVNPRPAATISGLTPICTGGSTTLTLNLTGSGAMAGTVTETDGTNTITNNYPFSGTSANPVILTGITPATSSTYTISTLQDANCISTGVAYLPNYTTITVNPLPLPVVITPGNTTICSGSILPLSSVENHAGNFIFNQPSSINNIAIPDNYPTGINNTITVPAGTIPVGGIVDSIGVVLNVQHPEVNDLLINLGAPDGKIITLAASSLYGPNLTNTNISSRASQYPVVTTGTPPYTGTYSAQGDNIYGAEAGNANTRKFTDLFGTTLAPPNGDWTIYLADTWADNIGTLQDWALTIYYHVPVNPVDIVWSPLDSLFTDPSATIAYTGIPAQTVYAKPSATTTYTGRSTDPNSCTTASDVTITVTPAPEVTVIADYCAVPNKVQLTASSVPVASSYIWNTGETTSVIDVDEAKLYTVAATTGLHCVGTGFLSIAQELVKNGDFEAGNSGFYTQYGYVGSPGNQTGAGSLQPEGLYAVDSNAHNYHDNFFGKDHTTPGKTGKFMMLNGAPGTGVIWQETVPVLPNTNYYYSAWAMNLNNQSPFAELQFSVNGVPIGSLATNGIADLSTAPQPASTGDVNINNWVRFYYGSTDGWFSGSATTAVIQIIDLNTDRLGNDFGLDDISFATLSTFITLTSASGTDDQSVCRGDKIIDITYKVGSGGTPTVTGLPNGVTAEFKNGITLIISGTPDDNSGVYNYTITTTGACSNPTTATGQITVTGQKVTLSSPTGTDGQTVCKGKPITSVKYTLSESATDYVVTGLPAEFSVSRSGNVITITGSPADSGTFTYKIKTLGSTCNADSLEGTIRSNVQTIVKTSGDDNQKLCINNDISDIVYKIGGTGAGVIVSGLPTGVTGNYAGGIYTIFGNPTVSGVFDYTITTSGTCDAAAITGTITVYSNATVNLSSASGSDAQVICYNGSINNITYNTTGVPDAGITVTDLPDGVNYTVNGGTVVITGTPTVSGSFNYTVKATGTCVEASKSGTITIDALINTGTSFTANYTGSCGTAIGTLQLNGFSGTIKDWEFSTDGGATWDTAPNTTGVFDFTVLSTTYFRAVFDGGACEDAYSNPYAIGVHNLWTGAVSADWNDVNNWSDNNLPSTSCPDVIIPQVPASNYYPVLASGTATITNLIINSNASVTVNGTGKMQIGGAVTNVGVFDITAGTVEFNGVSTQNIDGNTFRSNTIQNLIVSNANTLSVASTPGDTLKISGDLTFGTSDGKLNTGNNITLLSTASATADVGALTAANSITGDVIVERYLAALNNWEFVAIPTQTNQTINAAWQEGQTPGNVGPIGYGTNITGPVWANGLDFQSPNPSLKYWDNASQAYVNIDRTGITFPYRQNGYFLYIRGDRRATADLSTPHFPTVMRTKGALNTGPVSFNIPANTYYSLGNPYASRVDFRKIAGIGNVESTFYVWDPMISGYHSVGGYQTLSAATSYWPSTPSAYYLDRTPYPYLESGQAVFVNNGGNSGVTLTFNETAKVTGSRLIFRGEESSPKELIRTFLCTSSGRVIDGNAVAFSSRYKNGIDVNDAIKIKNPGENLGLGIDGVIFAVEARAPVSSIDTVRFDLTNLVKETYQFRFNPDNMDKEDLKAYLIDNYLKTTTDVSLSGITSTAFTVNSDAASYAADRFMVVFKRSTPTQPVIQTPFTFVSLTATEANKDILVVWNVKNENNLLDYEVEKSADGINFVKKETLNATNNGVTSYQWTDNQALSGDNYYRIRSVDKNAKVVYSTVVKVSISNLKSGISIYPNPITDAIIHLQFMNQPQGKYRIRLLNPLGQVILAKEISYAGGNGSEDIKWDYKMAHGMYQLEIIKPDQSVHIIKVLY